MKNPCFECEIHQQKRELQISFESSNGRGHNKGNETAAITQVFNQHCVKCTKRWEYVAAIEGIVCTTPDPGYEIYNLSADGLSSNKLRRLALERND